MQLKAFSNFAFTVLSPIFLVSCYISPPPIYQLSPTIDDTIWLSGKEYAADSTNGIITFVAFERSDGANLIFDVEITNESGEQVLVTPEDFYYLPRKNAADTISQRQIHALSPEANSSKLIKAFPAKMLVMPPKQRLILQSVY